MTRAGAARVVVDFLADAGVRLFFTVPGESFLEIIDEVQRRPGLRLVSCRHESGAAFMAEAVGKLTGRPAVALATRAVGAANLAIGVHTARQDSTPMLVLLGQVETERLGREAFQEVDLPRFYAELTVHAETVHRADRAGEAVARAYRLATGLGAGRPGPAMLAFPADVLAGECPPAPPVPVAAAAVVPSPAVAGEVASALRGASRPVVVAGRGAQLDPAAVRRLAERFGLGVYTAFRRQDAFPGGHPQHLGHLGLGTPPELLEPLRTADVVLVLGCRLSEITSQSYALPPPTACVIQVDPHPGTLGATVPVCIAIPCAIGPFVDAVLVADDAATTAAATVHAADAVNAAAGDATASVAAAASVNAASVNAAASVHAADAVNAAAGDATASVNVAASVNAAADGAVVEAGTVDADNVAVVRNWAEAHGRWVRLSTPPADRGGPGAVHPAAVLAAMRRRLPADAVMVNDAGNFAAFCHRYWPFEYPHTQLGPTSGAMGYAVPAAVGAQLAAPDRRVVALAGDGGFLMTGQELETAARCGAPVLVVVFQNGLYGTIAQHQARATGRPAAVDIGLVDLAGFARSLGATAVTVEHPDQLDAAFVAATTECPHVVVVRTDPDVIAPAATLSALLAEHHAEHHAEPHAGHRTGDHQ